MTTHRKNHNSTGGTTAMPTMIPQADADAGELREALGTMATSVSIVTTRHNGKDYGFTANSFTSVSANPPLVAVFLAETADSYHAFQATDRVAVNILAEGQGDIATHFARKHPNKFEAVTLDDGHVDLPVIAGHMAAIKGTVHLREDAGDHLMILVHVDSVLTSSNQPLVYQNRSFRSLS